MRGGGAAIFDPQSCWRCGACGAIWRFLLRNHFPVIPDKRRIADAQIRDP